MTCRTRSLSVLVVVALAGASLAAQTAPKVAAPKVTSPQQFLGHEIGADYVLGHLTEAQRRAYRIADNKLTELGGWDEALLLQELQALLAARPDLLH